MNEPVHAPYSDRKITDYDRAFQILRYFYPEFVTALVLYAMVNLIDAKFIACLKSTEMYATVGVTNTLVFFITKIAEGLSVGTVIVCGQYEGKKSYDMVGKSAVAALWTTAGVGALVAGFLYCKVEWIYQLLCISDGMVQVGIPFLKLRALSIFFMFLFFALVGFLRGIKDTRSTMYFFVLGAVVFVLCDYVLIFGAWGLSPLGLQGSALAAVIQYMTMFGAALVYIMCRTEYKRYRMALFKPHVTLIRKICELSWPVMFDKAALQAEKIWLIRLIAPMGSYALGAMGVIKDIEMLAFVPAVAFGQVVTLLVSNEYGANNIPAIGKTTKIILYLAAAMVLGILVIFSMESEAIITIFDRQRAFTDFAAQVFPVLGVLVFFDLLQLILAGALRGTTNVRIVMITRVVSAVCIFMPLSYLVSLLPFESLLLRFIVIYGSFNIVNGLTSLVYVYWFCSGRWQGKKVV